MNQRDDDIRPDERSERGRESNGGNWRTPPRQPDYGHGQAGQSYDPRNEQRGYGGGEERYGRSYWNDRPSWQDHYGLGQRTHWREPFEYRGEQPGRSRYREGTSAGHFPRDQYGHEHSSEQLFGRQAFGPPEDPHYYGTGAAGWGGPGYTGGAYAYGNGPRDQERQLESEYSDESALSYEQPARPAYGPTYAQRYGREYGRYPIASRPNARNPYPQGPKGYQRSDERLKEDISERLMESHYIDCSEVSVDVRGAKVVLEGSVPSRHMKHAIEDLVDACPGVQDIDNRVRVAGAMSQSQSQAGGGSQSNLQTSGAGSTALSGSVSGTSAGSSTSMPNNGTRSRQ
jgi:osmotically-inducible protein OsmY